MGPPPMILARDQYASILRDIISAFPIEGPFIRDDRCGAAPARPRSGKSVRICGQRNPETTVIPKYAVGKGVLH